MVIEGELGLALDAPVEKRRSAVERARRESAADRCRRSVGTFEFIAGGVRNQALAVENRR
jgi:hypothetical protein